MLSRSLIAAAMALAAVGVHGFAQQVDVRNYGAACNGSTDDSGALQAALNAVPSGGTVNIPCKLAVGSSGVRLANKSNVTITGTATGAGIRVLAPTGQNALGFSNVSLLVQSCSNCAIRNLEFDGNGVAAVPLGLDRSTGVTVDGNYVHDVGDGAAGIVSAGGHDNKYTNNRIINSSVNTSVSSRGMWIGNASSSDNEWNAYIAQNTLKNISATGIATHIIGATIVNNNVDTTLGAGIKLTPPGGNTAQSLVQNNVLRNNLFHGIQVDGGHDMVIDGNTSERNANNGIFTTNDFSRITISNNIIRDNNLDASGGWAAGVWIETTGISINDITIKNNQIYDSRTGSARTQDIGVMLNSTNGGISNVRIESNTCNNGTQSGIGMQTWGSSGSTIDSISVMSNTCTNNDQYGMWIYERGSGSITNITEGGNTFSPNGQGTILCNTAAGYKTVSVSGGGDTTPPSVNITSPLDQATVTGAVTLAATATDNVGVTGVQFQVDGSNVGGPVSAGATVQWDSLSVPNGSHNITAVAWDAAGNRSTPASIWVNVSNNVSQPPSGDTVPPSVSISSPLDQATVTGATTLADTATDNVGVTGVQFQVDGSNVGGPVSAGATVPWDSRSVPNGSHNITAVAWDAAGNKSAPASIWVNIYNAPSGDTTPPSVSITSPLDQATVMGTATLATTASDNVGVTGVEFQVDGSNVGGPVSAGATVQWDSRSVPNGSHNITAVAWDAAGNRSAPASIWVNVYNSVSQPPSGSYNAGLVVNGGFEDGTQPWTGLTVSAGIDPTVAYDGTHSAFVQAASDGERTIQQDIRVYSGVYYSLSAYVRTSGAAPVARILWLNSSGKVLGQTTVPVVSASQNWTFITAGQYAPRRCKTARIVLGASAGGGTVWLDDVSLLQK